MANFASGLPTLALLSAKLATVVALAKMGALQHALCILSQSSATTVASTISAASAQPASMATCTAPHASRTDGRLTRCAIPPSLGRQCFSKHAAGQTPSHKISLGIKKKAVRSSPRAVDRVAQQVQRNATSEPARSAARRL